MDKNTAWSQKTKGQQLRGTVAACCLKGPQLLWTEVKKLLLQGGCQALHCLAGAEN